MKCHEVQEALGVYWDLPENDPERMAIDRHLQQCESCMEEFRIWEESEAMIRSAAESPAGMEPMDDITRGVMERIYMEQAWMQPINERRYQLSKVFKRNVAAVIACCMAMFVCGFVYFLFGERTDPQATVSNITGLLDTVNANEGISLISTDFYNEIPVASISDPFVLNVVPTVPQYWVALSILGIIVTLLILNWLSRTRT
ncbi:anti-sigma factor family protein [Paenibacillus sp. SYP-B4298]|uniref:anti-sigma factor family protein n=1 Tax=Paenibacillus sp. SYP-B4298 TaxID=2996034 RepID=UPI0022DD890E|nr:zf-HC2 domain-containing protein [Paenibacillus sp. SYP-B4298]